MKTPGWLVQKAPSRFQSCSAREWRIKGGCILCTNWNCPENVGWFQQISRISTGQKSKFTNFEKFLKDGNIFPKLLLPLEENIAVFSDLSDGESSPTSSTFNKLQHRSLVEIPSKISSFWWQICRFFFGCRKSTSCVDKGLDPLLNGGSEFVDFAVVFFPTNQPLTHPKVCNPPPKKNEEKSDWKEPVERPWRTKKSFKWKKVSIKKRLNLKLLDFLKKSSPVSGKWS